MGWKEDWDELNKKKRAQKEAVADVTYRAYQQEREAQGFPSSSVSKGNDIISAVQNGINSLTQPKKEFTWNMKTARQRLLELELPRENWYSGEKPTTSEALAQIWRIGQTDKEKASRLYDGLRQYQNDPTTSFYDPYTQATNRKIADIAGYGIDVSGGITDEWFKKNAYLMNYYTYGTTNNPLGTAKKRSKEQNAAALYYDLLQDEEKTKKAENEWQALQDEVRYWTGRKDLNLSDQEILNRIDWNNYKTLSSMDESRENGAPIALNRAVGYSRDNLYGVIWEARNGQENGNITNDAVKYRLGAGNGYEENAEARARRDATSDYYNPYWNGIASDDMNETALYFGTDRFDQDWIDSHRYIMNGNDETAKREYLKVVAAEETTRKAEEEIKTLQDRVDSYIKLGITDPEKILDGILDADEYNDEPALSTLKKLDESLGDYKMMNTTRALQYSYRDLKREVERRCEEEKSKQPSYQFAKDVEKQYGAGHMVPPSQVQNDTDRTNIVHEKTSEDAVNEARDRNIQENAETIRSTGTPEEKVVYGTAASSTYNKDVGDISNSLSVGVTAPQEAIDASKNSANEYAGEYYLNTKNTIDSYEKLDALKQEALQRIEELKKQYGIGGSSSRVDMSRVVGTSGSSGGKLNANGAAGSKNYGKGNIDLTKRIPVMNEDGSVSTVDSFSVGMTINGQEKEVLLPTIINGQRVSEEEAIQHYEKTGEYLGIFDTPQEADEYAEQLHREQEEQFERDYRKFQKDHYDFISEVWASAESDEEAEAEIFEGYLRSKGYEQYAQYGDDAQEMMELEAMVAEYDRQMAEQQTAYDAAQDTMRGILEQFGIVGDIAELTDEQLEGTDLQDWSLMADVINHYEQPEVPKENPFDELVRTGQYSREQVTEGLKAAREELLGDLELLTKAHDTVGPYMLTTKEQTQRYNWERQDIEREIKGIDYTMLSSEPDFQAKADEARARAAEKQSNRKWYEGQVASGVPQVVAAIVDPDYANIGANGQPNWNTSLMTKEEQDRLLYLWSEQGAKAANEYYEYLNDNTYGTLTRRRSEQETEQAQALVNSGVLGAVAANIASLMASPGRSAAGAEGFFNALTGKQISEYSRARTWSNYNNAVKQTTRQNIVDAFGEDSRIGSVAGSAYDVFASAFESTMGALFMGSVGLPQDATTAIGKFGLKMADSVAGAANMAMGAAGDKILEVYKETGSLEKAMLMGGATFLSETLSEAISIGNITDSFNRAAAGDPGAIKQLVKSFFEEGSEEVAGGLFENWADEKIMGELSERSKKFNEFKAQIDPSTGDYYTDERAWQLTDQSIFEQLMYDGFTGGLSGAVGVGIGGIAGAVESRVNNTNTQQGYTNVQTRAEAMVNDYLTAEKDTKAAEREAEKAERLAEKARERANDDSLAPAEREAAEAEAQQAEAQAEEARNGLRIAQGRIDIKNSEAFRAMQEGAEQFHRDYAAAQEAEAKAQEAQGTENEEQARAEAEKAAKQAEASRYRAEQKYMALAEELGLEVDAYAITEQAAETAETAEESTETPAEEVTAPNAEQATIEEKQPLTQEERERAQQKVKQLEAEARQAEEEAEQARKQAENAKLAAERDGSEEAQAAVQYGEQKAQEAEANARRLREEADSVREKTEARIAEDERRSEGRAQNEAAGQIGQETAETAQQPRQNRFGIAVNEAEAQRVVNDVTALNKAGSGEYDQSSKTAAVAAVLTDSTPGTMGSTAAQHLMAEYGADKVLTGMKKILANAVNRAGVSLTEAKTAIVTAAMNVKGNAHQILDGMLNGQVTATRIKAMIQAAQTEVSDPAVVQEMADADRENRIDQRSKELAGNDQSQTVAKAKETVSSIKEKASNLRSMMNDLRTKYDNAGEYIWQLTQEYCKLSAEGKQDAADSVGNQRNNAYKQRASLKDSFNKAAQEFVDAQNALKKAMEDLRSARQQRENELRAQAIAEIDAEDAAAAQAMAEQQAAAEAAAQAAVDRGITAEEATIEPTTEEPSAGNEQAAVRMLDRVSGIENGKGLTVPQIRELLGEDITPEISSWLDGLYEDPKFTDGTPVWIDALRDKIGELFNEQPTRPNGPGIRAYRGNAQYNGTETNAGSSRVTVSPYQSAVNLADSLGIGHSIGTRKMNDLPRSVRGYYKTNAQYLAVRSGDAGNYRVTMHEIWHHLGQKLGMEGTQQMVQSLPQAFREGYSKAELPGEAFAEFGWRYIMGDEAARNFAGDAFTDEFEKAIRKSGDYDAIQKARNEVQGWINGTLSERLGAVIRNKSDANRQRTSLRDRIANIVDDTSAAEAMNRKIRRQTGGNIPIENDVRKNGLLRNFKTTVANNLLNKALTDSNGTVIGDSLAKRFEDAGLDGKDFDEFSKYLLVKHSMDRDANGAPVFDIDSFPNETRQEWLDQMDREHPEFSRAADALQAFRTELMQAWLVDTGIMTQDQFDRLQEKYPNYVPTFRVMDQPGGQRATGNGSTFRIRRATGGTQDIVNPMDSFVDMVGSIVTTAKNNKVAQAFDNAYRAYEGMGEFARDVTQDVEKVALDMQALQEQVNKILEGNADGDVVKQVLDAIGPEQAEWRRTGKVNLPNVITVTRTDGSRAYYQVYDTELYNLLTGMRNNDTSEAIQTVAKLNHFMSAMTTGSNPIFAVRNFMRDFQNSVNYGSWASNYITGAAKWLRAMYDVWTEGGEYGDYMALGGGGWNRINTGTKAGAEEYRSGLFKGYGTSNAERTAKTALKAAGALVTLERLNEVVEQTSRYAEYKYGKHDKSTAEGRQEAFLASQDATVDFARSGNGRLAADLKAFIPFFGASLQGVYRTGRMLTEAERSRAPARFAKTIINTALTSAIAAGLMMRYSDDDEKKDFERMSDDLKSQHFYIPNFAPEIFGNQKLLRIPLAQDPLTYAVHGMVTNALWNGTSDGMMIDIAATANTILDNLMPIGSTVFDPLISMNTNRNWYGSNIVPSYMNDWDASTQYTEETPDMFVAAGRALGVSPLKLQYLAEQYTGFIGQLAIPALSKDEHSGEIGGWKAAISAARKRLTSDPLVSNNIVSSFYDGESLLKQAKKAAENERPLNMLRRGLTQDEVNAAYAEADEMLSSKGIIGTTKKAISQLYSDIDAINANPDLTDSEKYTLTTAKRREMANLALDAQEEIGAWKEKYVTGKNLLTSILYEGEKAEKPTAYTKMPAIFKEDAGQAYMQKANSVYEATGKDSALPHPLSESGTFSDNKTEYTLSDGNYDLYLDTYHEVYKNSVNSIKNWDSLTDAERLERLTKVHNAARDAAKAAWLKDYKLTH